VEHLALGALDGFGVGGPSRRLMAASDGCGALVLQRFARRRSARPRPIRPFAPDGGLAAAPFVIDMSRSSLTKTKDPRLPGKGPVGLRWFTP